MSGVVDSPFGVFGIFLVAQWVAAYLGDFARGRRRPMQKAEREDLDIVQTAILTLLALIIGFSFSMAVSRYDLRKTYEEAEANAIGTEYLRADLLPAEAVTAVRDLIRKWDLRVAFMNTTANARSAKLTPKPRSSRPSFGRRYYRRQGRSRRP